MISTRSQTDRLTIPTSDFVDGLRRVGNRFSHYSPKQVIQKQVKYSDWVVLVDLFESMWVGVDLRVLKNNSRRKEFVEVMKSMVSWERCVEKLNWLGSDDGKWVKKLYENPELIDK